ncbi:MAG TPA: MauE/DoxX family redox-associated membrane protein [Deltaproteobacteria bacterium]|jgi:uncharacterized membrane protein YphA (DoxX/SURF4 family)|nr:MauE/DoxX family redox-associated membrane protein [Deltaproteobacteria bacterium]HQI01710.1 MauE/DoxX family redox-associated membrane protein [Deltaproteobacteria bacterium]
MIRGLSSLVFSEWSYRIVRISLAALFIYGGGIKLLDPKAFARTISAYDLVPEMLLPVVAVGLPFIEAVAGIGLLFDMRGSLAVISSLIGMFIVVLGSGVARNLDADCGCFGPDELARKHGLVQAFWRDLALGGIVVPYLYLCRRVLRRSGKNGKKPSKRRRIIS